MLFSEVHTGAQIKVSFQVNNRHFSFTTTVIDMNRLSMIHVNGQPLHIRNSICEKIIVAYVNPDSGRTHIWKEVSIDPVEDSYYAIEVHDDSVQLNRRNAVRVPINLKALCEISNINDPLEVEVLDLSISGVSFSFNIHCDIPKLIGRTLRLEFSDSIEKAAFVINAVIVNVNVSEELSYRCGCSILDSKPPVNTYVNRKQISRMLRFTNHTTIKNDYSI